MMTIGQGFVSGNLGDDSGSNSDTGGDEGEEAHANNKENCRFEADVSRHGHEIHPAKDAGSREECCKICTNMVEPNQCMSWSFNKHTGVCYPQSSTDDSENSRMPDLCCDSGVIRSADMFGVSQEGESAAEGMLAQEQDEGAGSSGGSSSAFTMLVVLLLLVGLGSQYVRVDDDDDDDEAEGASKADGSWEKETSDRVEMEMQSRRMKADAQFGGEGVPAAAAAAAPAAAAAEVEATATANEDGDLEFEI
jgi:hypothetical protein